MNLLRSIAFTCLLGGLHFASPLPAEAIAQKGKSAPGFSLPTVTGQKLDLSTLRGKVVIADFFATWCAPCKDAIPHLIDLQQRFGAKGVQVIGLSADDEDDARTVREFVSSHRINYPVAITTEALQSEYGLRAVPVLYIIDKKGLVAEVFRGLNSETQKRLEVLINKLLLQ